MNKGWNMRVLGLSVLAVLSGVLYLPLAPANAASIWQMEPDHDAHPADVLLNFTLSNNNPGAIYNSATTSVGVQLGNELWQNPVNQSTYASKEEMLAAWIVSIRGIPTGDLEIGWNADLNPDGEISLTSGGRNYDQWTNASDSNDMALTIGIPKSQLERDGTPGYSPLTDNRIELGNPLADAFIGVHDQWNSYSANGFDYTVVPEPASLSLLTLGGLAMLRRRRRKAHTAGPRRRTSRIKFPIK